MDLKAYECRLCTNYLGSPIYKCYNDHSFCETCINSVQVCPTCRENLPLPKIRNAVLEMDITRSWFRCEFKDEGCDTVIKLNRMEHHTRSCKYRTGRHCAVLGFASCDKLVSMPRLMNHAKYEHKVTCLTTDLYKEFDIEQIISSGIGGQKNIKLARVKWEPVFIFLEETRHIFQLRTKFFNPVQPDSEIRWAIQERSSSGEQHIAVISFIKDSSQRYCETWTWVGPIRKEHDDLTYLDWFSLPSRLIAGRAEWRLRIVIKPHTWNYIAGPLTCTTINKIADDLDEPPAGGRGNNSGRIWRNSWWWRQLIRELGLPILLLCLILVTLIAFIIYIPKLVEYLYESPFAIGLMVLFMLLVPRP